jgi:hypothetical protein
LILTEAPSGLFHAPPPLILIQLQILEDALGRLATGLRIEKILDIFPTHSQNILRLVPPPMLRLLPPQENV